MNSRLVGAAGTVRTSFKSWLQPMIVRLGPFLPRLKETRFWIVQAIVVGVAGLHDYLEIAGYLPKLGALYFVPISIFFLPVVYAALNFGVRGSLATVTWIVLVTIPNWVLWHSGLERYGVMFQMLLFVAVAGFVGLRVDREASARRKAETASAALKAYAAHVVKVQEDERKNLARELHDESIQNLALLCRQLDGVARSQPLSPEALQELSKAREISEGVVRNLRDFARELRPPHLEDLGLVDSVNKLLLDFSDRTGIKSRLKSAWKEEAIGADTKVGLFRIMQEALWNVERHSKATELVVEMTFGSWEVILSIFDNGAGFNLPKDLEELSDSNHYGLVGMHERAELLGGKLEVQSAPGKGTRVTVSVPHRI
jgi:two-component system, NarL family, sensor histidine kinase DegS